MGPLAIFQIGMGILGALSGASAKKKEAKNNKKVAEFNANQLDKDAKRIRNKSVQDDNDLRLQYSGVQSSQRATLAARGVFVDSGTAENIQNDTDIMMELSSYRIRQSSEEQASALNQQAQFNRTTGEAVYSSQQSQATGMLLQGAGTVAADWYRYKNEG
jgi:hypothetical protein